MTSYHGWTHAPKAQGGTDPIPLPGGTTAALLTNLDFISSGTDLEVPDDTWETVAHSTQGRQFYNGWALDEDWDLDGETGTIRRLGPNHDGLYVAYARAVFQDASPGDKVGVAVDFPLEVTFSQNVIEATGSDQTVLVAVPFWGSLLAAGVSMSVYCSPSLTLGSGIQLHVRQFELSADGIDYDFS